MTGLIVRINTYKIQSEFKVCKCSPSIFLEGDIVQLQIAFVAFPLTTKGREKRFRIGRILRSVMLIDTELREVS